MKIKEITQAIEQIAPLPLPAQIETVQSKKIWIPG